MAREQFFHIHPSYAEAGSHDSHPSMASHQRRIDGADDRLREFYHPDQYYSEKAERREQERQELKDSLCD